MLGQEVGCRPGGGGQPACVCESATMSKPWQAVNKAAHCHHVAVQRNPCRTPAVPSVAHGLCRAVQGLVGFRLEGSGLGVSTKPSAMLCRMPPLSLSQVLMSFNAGGSNLGANLVAQLAVILHVLASYQVTQQ